MTEGNRGQVSYESVVVHTKQIIKWGGGGRETMNDICKIISDTGGCISQPCWCQMLKRRCEMKKALAREKGTSSLFSPISSSDFTSLVSSLALN